MLQHTIHHFLHYTWEVLPAIAVGFLLSGLIHEFLPEKMVQKHLGGRGFLPLFYATLIGTFLPICCIGSLPVAVSMHRKGASLGPILAFLVATPATSVSALMVTWALLGIRFTVFIFAAVIIMGMIVGFLGNLFRAPMSNNGELPSCCAPEVKAPRASCCTSTGKSAESCSTSDGEVKTAKDPICGMVVDTATPLRWSWSGVDYFFCNTRCMETFKTKPGAYAAKADAQAVNPGRLRSALHYAFIRMPKDLGLEIVIGLLLAAIIASIEPLGRFINAHLGGSLAYVISVPFGLAMYFCSTASVPFVQALLESGMNSGAGMTLLMVGPVTSVGTILVIRKHFGWKVLVTYLFVICVVSVATGHLYAITL